MRIDGEWYRCDDGVVRPIFRGEALASDDTWAKVYFLADTGADRTVFSADALTALQLQPLATRQQLAGVGGVAASILVNTSIRMTREDGTKVVFRGQYAGFTDPAALDMSALGRDISNLLALIVDCPGDIVCLLGQHHGYTISRK